MELLYIAWAVLLCCLAVAFLVMNAKEGRTMRRDDTAVNPLFSPGGPAARPRSSPGRPW